MENEHLARQAHTKTSPPINRENFTSIQLAEIDVIQSKLEKIMFTSWKIGEEEYPPGCYRIIGWFVNYSGPTVVVQCLRNGNYRRWDFKSFVSCSEATPEQIDLEFRFHFENKREEFQDKLNYIKHTYASALVANSDDLHRENYEQR